MAEAAHLLGVRRVMAVHGEDGLDEISVSARTTVVEVDETGTRGQTTTLTPESSASAATPWKSCGAGTAGAKRRHGAGPPGGQRSSGDPRSGAPECRGALYICGIARNVGDGYLRAREALQGGAALREAGAYPARAAVGAEAA